jgi:hypothetical protein
LLFRNNCDGEKSKEINNADKMDSLSIEKFNLLPKNEQADIIHAFGLYLMDYKPASFIYALYSLSDFHV